jgi:hypothetical protein
MEKIVAIKIGGNEFYIEVLKVPAVFRLIEILEFSLFDSRSVFSGFFTTAAVKPRRYESFSKNDIFMAVIIEAQAPLVHIIITGRIDCKKLQQIVEKENYSFV